MVAAWQNQAAGSQGPGDAPILLAQAESAADYLKSGQAHLNQGNLDQAIADFTKAIRLKPDLAQAYLCRGAARGSKKENDPAIADFTKAIQLQPDLWTAYNFRGIAYRKMGLYQKAIADITKAMELKPDYWVNYSILAWIFATSKDPKYRDGKRAVELARKAVKLNRVAACLDILAAAYAQSGNFKDAVKTQEEAIALLKEEDSGPRAQEKFAEFDKRLQAYKNDKPWRDQD